MTQAERMTRLQELEGNETFRAIKDTIASVEKLISEDLESGKLESLADFIAVRQKLIVKWSEMTGYRYRSTSETKELILKAKHATCKHRTKKAKTEKVPDKRIIRIRTKNFERLSKHEAYILLTEHRLPIYMFPNKVLPDNNWIMPTEVRPDEIENKEDFERIVNSFKFYNCNLPYLGTYVSYYRRAI